MSMSLYFMSMFEFVCVGSTSMFCKNVEFLCVCRGKYGSHAQAQKGPSQACAEETAQGRPFLWHISAHCGCPPDRVDRVCVGNVLGDVARPAKAAEYDEFETRYQNFDNVGERIYGSQTTAHQPSLPHGQGPNCFGSEDHRRKRSPALSGGRCCSRLLLVGYGLFTSTVRTSPLATEWNQEGTSGRCHHGSISQRQWETKSWGPMHADSIGIWNVPF